MFGRVYGAQPGEDVQAVLPAGIALRGLFLIDKDGILRKKAVGARESLAESDIRGLI